MVRLKDFLSAEKDTAQGEFLDRFKHGFLLINKSPEGGSSANFETRAADEARKMLIRTKDQAELYPLVATKRANRVTIGRTTINDIVLEGDSISKFHAYFRIDNGDGYSLCDPGSTNGTKVNGQALDKDVPCALKGGETIVFGDAFEATFHSAESLYRHLTMLKRWTR